MRLYRVGAFRSCFRPTRSPSLHQQGFAQRCRYMSQSQQGNSPIQIQRPFSARRRFLTFTLYTASFYVGFSVIFNKLGDILLDKDLGEEEEPIYDEDGNRVVDEDDSLFIAFQYPRKLPQVQYTRDDPEWRDYVKITGDKGYQEKIGQELASDLARMFNHKNVRGKGLGKDVKATRIWLEVKVPVAPPPDYVRKGIELTPDAISWTEETIDQTHFDDLQRLFVPVVLATALWSGVDRLWSLQVLRVKQLLGLKLSPEDKLLEKISNKIRDRERESLANSDRKAIGFRTKSLDDVEEPGRTSLQETSPTPADQLSESNNVTSTDSNTNPTRKRSFNTLVPWPLPPLPNDFQFAFGTFLAALVRGYAAQAAKVRPPRGSIIVSGQIELTGSRGRAKLNVAGIYDPKAQKYLAYNAEITDSWLPRG